MNIRRVTTSTQGQRIFARIEVGHAPEPVVHHLEIDAAMALVFAGQLEAAVQKARNDGIVHKRGSDKAPVPVTYRGGRPRLAGVRRKPTWELTYIQAKVKAAVFAIMVEAETHRLEPDALDYVRTTKKKLCE